MTKKTTKLTPPNLGAITWVKVYETETQTDDNGNPVEVDVGLTSDKAFAGLELAVQYFGGTKTDEWQQRLAAENIEDVKRLAEHRKGLTAKEAPELFTAHARTHEHVASISKIATEIVTEAVVGFAWGDEQVVDEDAIAALVQDLPSEVRLRGMRRVMDLQSLSRRHVFLASDPGDLEIVRRDAVGGDS